MFLADHHSRPPGFCSLHFLFSDEDMTVEMMEHVMRIPIKEPRVLSLSPAEMARRIVELRFKAVRQNVAQMVIFEPAVLVVEDEELDAYLKEKNFL